MLLEMLTQNIPVLQYADFFVRIAVACICGGEFRNVLRCITP